MRARQPILTTILALANIAAYAATIDATGHLRPEIRAAYGYSGDNLAARGPIVLVTSTFLHDDPLHIASNLVLLLIAAGALERRVGAARMAIAFAVPALLGDPITLLLLRPPPGALDVGASLGIFGCAGALAVIEPRRRWVALAVGLALASIGSALASRSVVALNHLPALALGAAVGALLGRRQEAPVR